MAQRVTQFSSNITDEVEATAWSYQNNLGGITTQSWLNGTVYGTANAEATSALLLAYNDPLIERLQKQQSYADYLYHRTKTQRDDAWYENKILSDDNARLEAENNAFGYRSIVLMISTIVLAIISFIQAIWIKR